MAYRKLRNTIGNTTKATAKAGRANKLKYLIERKKTSRNGHREARNKG